jgi:hypothetical protein
MAKRHPWAGFKSKDPPKIPTPVPPRRDRFIEIDKEFGRLTCISETDEAEVWLFRCTCGKRVKATAKHLRDGKRSCGCLRKEMSAARLPPPKVVDMTDQTWHDLTVLDRVGSDEDGAALWRCRCKCGFIGVHTGVSIRAGETKSCGCRRTTRHGTLIGREFGSRTVTGQVPGTNKDRIWIYTCSCGKTGQGRADQIRNRKPCKCQRRA